jgi:hypothetical protein
MDYGVRPIVLMLPITEWLVVVFFDYATFKGTAY